MSNPLGALLITIGLLLFFGAWSTKNPTGLIFGLTIGPALISYGYLLIK